MEIDSYLETIAIYESQYGVIPLAINKVSQWIAFGWLMLTL